MRMPTKKKKKAKKGRNLTPCNGDDVVYTPDSLADQVVRHFLPQMSGRILEPCSGGGAFTRAFTKNGLTDVTELEIKRGQDFFEFKEQVDWVVTNPPWSLARRFAQQAYQVSHDVVFLITVNHFMGLRARFDDMEKAGFRIKEIVLCNTPPKPWPQSGFQLGAIHFQKNYKGPVKVGRLNEEAESSDSCGTTGCQEDFRGVDGNGEQDHQLVTERAG